MEEAEGLALLLPLPEPPPVTAVVVAAGAVDLVEVEGGSVDPAVVRDLVCKGGERWRSDDVFSLEATEKNGCAYDTVGAEVADVGQGEDELGRSVGDSDGRRSVLVRLPGRALRSTKASQKCQSSSTHSKRVRPSRARTVKRSTTTVATGRLLLEGTLTEPDPLEPRFERTATIGPLEMTISVAV